MALQLTSPAFTNNGYIPKEYTCDGQNISPALAWNDIPAGTQSFVLIMDDPDAPNGTWYHWLLYNIPANVTDLAEDLPQLPQGAQAGLNSWGDDYYGGPCPPSNTHRYFFKLYALNTSLNFSREPDYQQLMATLQNHILDQTTLVGLYRREK